MSKTSEVLKNYQLVSKFWIWIWIKISVWASITCLKDNHCAPLVLLSIFILSIYWLIDNFAYTGIRYSTESSLFWCWDAVLWWSWEKILGLCHKIEVLVLNKQTGIERTVCKSMFVFCCDSWLSSHRILQHYTRWWQVSGISLCHPQSLLVSDVHRRPANLGFVFKSVKSFW